MATYYALRKNGTLDVSCISKTDRELGEKIDRAFWNWIGMQSKGSSKTVDDFMEGRTKSKIVVEDYV